MKEDESTNKKVVQLFDTEAGGSVDEIIENNKGEFTKLLMIGYNDAGEQVVAMSEGFTYGTLYWLLQSICNDIMQGEF